MTAAAVHAAEPGDVCHTCCGVCRLLGGTDGMCICKVGCEEDEYWRNCEDPGEMIAKFRWVNPLGDKKFAEHQTEFRTRRATDTDEPRRAQHTRALMAWECSDGSAVG